MRRRAALLFVSVLAAAAPSLAVEEGAPLPHGWVGTTEEWARGLGILFALADLLLLIWLLRSARRGGLTSVTKQTMFIAVAVLPIALVFFSYSYSISASQKVEACAACHVMEPWIKDLQDPKSENLAAVHYKNRYIQENHCYTCHSDYGMAGSMKAKLEGFGHIVHNTTGVYERPIKIAKPYPNFRCLQCHATAQKFLDPAKHPKEDMPDLLSGKTSCIDCHGPVHPKQPAAEKKASL